MGAKKKTHEIFGELQTKCKRTERTSAARNARWLAAELGGAGVTVLSGMARGIDTAAHSATLEAGGRTIAVMGTGITRCYPAENANLAERILERGALVTQFWPTAHPARYNFPRRNVVMLGMGQGTVVVEATRTSGAKMQARLALEHGKRVFLLRSLVTSQAWGRDYVGRRALEVESADLKVHHLTAPRLRPQSRCHAVRVANAVGHLGDSAAETLQNRRASPTTVAPRAGTMVFSRGLGFATQ